MYNVDYFTNFLWCILVFDKNINHSNYEQYFDYLNYNVPCLVEQIMKSII